MPFYRDVEVEVLGSNGRGLKEYGEIRNSRMNTKSCFIQSETNATFRIRILPDEEIIRQDGQTGDYEEGDSLSNQPNVRGSKSKGQSLSLAGEIDEYGRDNSKRVTPWHLVATLKLDGRQEIEKRAIVCLDRNHELFTNDDGEVIMKSAIMRDQNGDWKECEWLFKDVGIDVSFESLQLSGEQNTVLAQEEDELANAFGAMSATNESMAEEKSKVGQIEVRLDRVRIGKIENEIAPHLLDIKDLTELQGSAIGDSGHTVGRIDGSRVAPPPRTVRFHWLDDQDSPYAIFKFNYCDAKKLRKLGFLPPLPVSQDTDKRANALKIAAAVQKKKKPANAFKFRNLETAEIEDADDGDDELSGSDVDGGDETEAAGQSQDLPLDDFGEKLGELSLDRIRKRDDDGEDEGEKKVRAE